MTLAYSRTGGNITGRSQVIRGYIVATGNDTTATINGPAIDNTDGRVSAVGVQAAVSDKSGTSPTANLQLVGSNDATNWFVVNNASAAAIQSGAQSTSGAGGGTTIGINFDTAGASRTIYPPYLAVRLVQAGTTPGITANVTVQVVRGHN